MTEKEKNTIMDEFKKHQEEIRVMSLYERVRNISKGAKNGKPKNFAPNNPDGR